MDGPGRPEVHSARRSKEVNPMARVSGELVAVDWDENDEPLEIAIEMDGERYMIAHTEQYDELLRYLGHEVEVQGKILRGEPGEQVIGVRSFEVLEPMTEEECDEYGDEEDIPEDVW
jgi:hypothetical protein